MITIELTDADASLFRSFRENQDVFKELLESGVFNVRSGKAILHFNLEGKLDSVDLDISTFRRGRGQIQFLSTKGLTN